MLQIDDLRRMDGVTTEELELAVALKKLVRDLSFFARELSRLGFATHGRMHPHVATVAAAADSAHAELVVILSRPRGEGEDT